MPKRKHHEDHWIPLTDLMTGLMIIFLLISIVFMEKVESEAKKTKQIALIYDEIKANIYQDLHSEFSQNLKDWGAELDRDLTLRFKEPSVLFDTGKDTLKPKFETILNDFFPRYIKVITREKYRSSIEEIRIEGHTSSSWTGVSNNSDAYFLNMALSQSRTRTTLKYLLSIENIQTERAWLISHLTANGLSSSHLIYSPNGLENKEASQRVEFRLRTNADERLVDILKSTKK